MCLLRYLHWFSCWFDTTGCVDDLSCFDYSSPFCFYWLNFIVLFPFLIKYFLILFIIIVFRLGSDKLVSCFFCQYIIVFDKVLIRSSPVSFQDFYCSLPRDQSRDVTPRLGVSVIEECTSFCVLTSCFRLLLLRLCNNRCAEALVAYRNSLLNRLNIGHGGKIPTIMIIIIVTLGVSYLFRWHCSVHRTRCS